MDFVGLNVFQILDKMVNSGLNDPNMYLIISHFTTSFLFFGLEIPFLGYG